MLVCGILSTTTCCTEINVECTLCTIVYSTTYLKVTYKYYISEKNMAAATMTPTEIMIFCFVSLDHSLVFIAMISPILYAYK